MGGREQEETQQRRGSGGGECLMLAHWQTNCVTCLAVAVVVGCVNPCWPIKPLVIYKDNDKVSPATHVHVHVPNDVPAHTNTHTHTLAHKDTAGKSEIKLNTLKNASQIYKSPFGQRDEEKEEGEEEQEAKSAEIDWPHHRTTTKRSTAKGSACEKWASTLNMPSSRVASLPSPPLQHTHTY